MASAVQLSRHDSHVLNLLFDAEATQQLEQLSHTSDTVARQLSCETDLQIREKAILATLNLETPELEVIDRAIHDFTQMIKENPGYASAYNNRSQARRMKYGDDGLFIDLKALSESVKDLANAISLSTPENEKGTPAPRNKNVLQSAYTHRGLLTYKASKLDPERRSQVAQIIGVNPEDLEAAASKDFHLGGKYGNKLAHQLSVYTNPYAKLCGQMVKESMQREIAAYQSSSL